MGNPVVRHESCKNCGKDYAIHQYSQLNHTQVMRVATDSGNVLIGECCWNKLINDQIQWTALGWELVKPLPNILHGLAQFEDANKNGGR